ncbi:MAG: hypothetical protein H6599_07810 [Flavobacteriales bacterium]|nr:hypothetical protein [Flavobacteriales bacterium]
MKKLFVYGLSIALVAGAASCKKSSKGKMSNEWTMSAMTQTSSDKDTNGDVTSSSMTVADGVLTMVETDANGDKTTYTGTADATWTIEKDGTWSRTMNMKITSYTSGGTTVDVDLVNVETSSGTWDFLGGVTGDFKKNERVVFHTLSSSSSQTFTFSGTSSTDVDANTYAEGEMSEVMVIVESKGKELEMMKDESNSNTYTPDGGSASTSSSTSSMTVTLTQGE